MDWKQLKELIELVSEKGFAEFEVERQGFRLRISNLKPATLIQGRTLQNPGVPANSDLDASDGSDARIPDTQPLTSLPPVARSQKQPPASTAQGAESGLHILKSPIVGTFYRSPSPESAPFVTVGDHVEPDTVVCIIEAMKLMNEIQAEIRGQIAEIYVDNSQPIEFDQPLFGIRV